MLKKPPASLLSAALAVLAVLCTAGPARATGFLPPSASGEAPRSGGDNMADDRPSGLASVAETAATAKVVAPPPAPTKGGTTQPEGPPTIEDGYARLGFDRLAGFKFVPPEFDPNAKPGTLPPSVADQIPDAIKKFNGQKAIVTGFMLPVKMEGGLVTEFLLVSSPMLCCYGTVPNMNEWVVVRMAKGVKPLMDVPINCYGRLVVKEQYDNGFLTGIYLLDGERYLEPKG